MFDVVQSALRNNINHIFAIRVFVVAYTGAVAISAVGERYWLMISHFATLKIQHSVPLPG